MRIVFCMLILAVFILPVFAQQETLTITTYYPAPFGVYEDIRVHGRMVIGNANQDAGGVIDDNDFPRERLTGTDPLDESLAIGGHLFVGTNAAPGFVKFKVWDNVSEYGEKVSFAHIGTDRSDANTIWRMTNGIESWDLIVNENNGDLHILEKNFPLTEDPPQAIRLAIKEGSGDIGISTLTPSDGTASGGQQLKLDVEGAVGATHYCDEDGLNCATPPLGGFSNAIHVYDNAGTYTFIVPSGTTRILGEVYGAGGGAGHPNGRPGTVGGDSSFSSLSATGGRPGVGGGGGAGGIGSGGAINQSGGSGTNGSSSGFMVGVGGANNRGGGGATNSNGGNFGGGAGGCTIDGGGGGAGGVATGILSVTPGTSITVRVGAGGASATGCSTTGGDGGVIIWR